MDLGSYIKESGSSPRIRLYTRLDNACRSATCCRSTHLADLAITRDTIDQASNVTVSHHVFCQRDISLLGLFVRLHERPKRLVLLRYSK